MGMKVRKPRRFDTLRTRVFDCIEKVKAQGYEVQRGEYAHGRNVCLLGAVSVCEKPVKGQLKRESRLVFALSAKHLGIEHRELEWLEAGFESNDAYFGGPVDEKRAIELYLIGMEVARRYTENWNIDDALDAAAMFQENFNRRMTVAEIKRVFSVSSLDDPWTVARNDS